MPGIHIRETSFIDCTKQKENPTITVPGSYWLCHKNKIYKFIFKYYRTARNTTHFPFGKELLKVIRKIIKNEPFTGQQFRTFNLLVTYSYAVWTRKDKIFAMTKFKERSVTAFSHAFILTIKIDTDQSLVIKNLADSYNNDLPEQKSNEARSDNDSAINKSPNKEPVTPNELPVNARCNGRQKLDEHSENTDEKSGKESEKADEDDNLVNGDTDDLRNETIGDCANREFAVDKLVDKNSISEPSNIKVECWNTDTANLPYQYLIEREIENAKLEITKPDVPDNPRKRKREETQEKSSTSSTEQVTGDELDFVAKRKRGLPTQRSSDITDLVMEGLMFTIRQDQDTVAVIEQKTKLEIDEVLENSEKIETKKGEKCLRNSSLLGLENLITMIELPNNAKVEQKYQNLRENSLRSRLFYDDFNCSLNDFRAAETGDNDLGKKEQEKQRNEDITQEALQHPPLQPVLSPERNDKPKESTISKESLTDDLVFKTPTKTVPELRNKTMINECRRSKSSVPVIISNEVISPDQIPYHLQKMLKHSLSQTNRIVDPKEQSTYRNFSSNMQLDVVQNDSPTLETSNIETWDESALLREQQVDPMTRNISNEENNKLQEQFDTSEIKQLQDVTNEFYEDIMYLQREKNKNNRVTNEISTKNNVDTLEHSNARETRIEMVKFFNDITKGAKVVVKRMSTKRIHSILAKNSSIPTNTH